MLSPRWRKVIADLWTNKTRTLLVILSVAVGIFAIGSIMGGGQVLSREMTESYSATNPPSAEIYVGGVDDDLVRSLANMGGVQEAEGRNLYGARFRVDDSDWKQLLVIATDYEAMHIATIAPESGAWPPPDRELLMERFSMSYLGVEVGESILLELPDGSQREMRVAGVVHDMSQISPTFQGVGAVYTNLDTLEWLGLPSTYSRMMIVTDSEHRDEDSIREVAEEVKTRIEKSGAYCGGYYVPTPGKHPADEVVMPVFMLLGVMGALALGLAGFLVLNTISAILSQQVPYIGMMKAVGGRRSQIVGQYLVLVLAFGLLALGVAVPLGALGARACVDYMAALLNIDVASYVAPLQVYVIQALVGLVVPVVAALIPVLRTTRITVRKALNTYGLSDRAHEGLVDRLLSHLRGLPRPMMLSLRNTFRRKGRLMLTLATLTLAGAIFMAVISVRVSLKATLDEALDYWNHEVTLEFRNPYRISKVEQEALSNPQVLAAECWMGSSAQRVLGEDDLGETMYLIAPPAETTMIKPTLLEGRWLLSDDENAVVINSLVLKDDPGIKVGDDIVLKLNKGGDDIDRTFHVVGLVKGVMTGPIGYVNYPYLARTLGWVNRAYSVRMQVRPTDPGAQSQLARELEEQFNRAGLRVSSREVLHEVRERVWGQLQIIVSLLIVMSALFALVGGLGLMGTMSINVLERTREIGVMRAIGANNGSVLQVVLVEGVIIGLVSWALGALCAYPLSQALTSALGQAVLRSPVTHHFPAQGVLLWLGLAVAIAMVSSFFPARKASSLTVRDVLAYL